MNKIKNNRLSKSFSVWGRFEDYETNIISNVKKIVNSKFKGPDFQIHVTLAGPLLKYDEATNLVLKNLCLVDVDENNNKWKILDTFNLM